MNQKIIATPTTATKYTMAFIHEKIDQLQDEFIIEARHSFIFRYALYSKDEAGNKGEDLHSTIELGLTAGKRGMHIHLFKPAFSEYFQKDSSGGLASALFYLVTKHFSKHFELPANPSVKLDAAMAVFETFYEPMPGFNFQLQYPPSSMNYYGTRYVTGQLPELIINTADIIDIK